MNLIPEELKKELNFTTIKILEKMSEEQFEMFLIEYKRRKKNTALAYLLFLIGFHYIYLGKPIFTFLYWITGWGFMFWFAIDLVRTYYMVQGKNRDIALEVIREIKLLNN